MKKIQDNMGVVLVTLYALFMIGISHLAYKLGW